jgi:mRNA-degrading endonuclease RelE of RelBE toxin-antitoxin system
MTTINTHDWLDIKLTNLTQIKLEHNIDINKNVVIALNTLDREEKQKTVKAIVSLKDNWQKIPLKYDITLVNQTQEIYAKKVDESLIILFKLEDNGVIHLVDLTRIERIKQLQNLN